MTAADERAPVPPRPALSPLQRHDPLWLLFVNAGVVAYMWVVHGGFDRIGPDGWWIAIAQITGLYAALASLLGLVLISRAPWLERRYGMDRMTHYHRYTGFTAAGLMIVHVVAATIGYARDSGISIGDQIVDSVANYPYVLNAVIGFGLLMVLALTSLRAIRRRLSYEHWWFVHLGAYAGVALAFGHQTAVGTDFVRDGWAVAYWSLLYASVALVIFVFRWVAPITGALRHRLRVSSVDVESPGVVTITLTGPKLDRLASQAGQFFLLRVLTARGWWKAHPFSLSAPPDGRSLRFTVKALGDDTTELQSIESGTRIMVEGPYGGFLPFRQTDRKLLFIAGGIGITPFRGIVDELEKPEDAALLYRNRTPDDAVFIDRLRELSEQRGFALRLSFSRLNGGEADPFRPEQLREFLPDIEDRDVFVIGSPRLIASARRGLRAAGVPAGRIHFESFTY